MAGKTTRAGVSVLKAVVLGVLCAVLAADGDAEDEGHFQKAAGHGLPLGHLVEDFIAGAAHEIAVHEFGDHAAAGEGVADGGAGDGGFGDGGVEEAVVGEGLGEAAVDGEGAAPVAVYLAVGDEGGVFVEAVDDGFEEHVAQLNAFGFWGAVLPSASMHGAGSCWREIWCDSRFSAMVGMRTSGLRRCRIFSTLLVLENMTLFDEACCRHPCRWSAGRSSCPMAFL